MIDGKIVMGGQGSQFTLSGSRHGRACFTGGPDGKRNNTKILSPTPFIAEAGRPDATNSTFPGKPNER